jgi:predicted dehydrogenase
VKRYRAAVVGLGKIGLDYDYSVGNDNKILTHAHAYAAHPGYDLVGAVDPDAHQRLRFEEKYRCRAYADVSDLFAHCAPEVLSLAVPINVQSQTFREVVNHGPTAILCEKPLATSVVAAEEMLSIARNNGCSLAVNYIRRFEPGTVSLKALLAKGDLGGIQKGVAWYSKGVWNNGSHLINLLQSLLGDVTNVSVTRVGRRWQESDPEPDLLVIFGTTPVYVLAAQEEQFSIHEFELVGTKGIVRSSAGGNCIEIRDVVPSGRQGEPPRLPSTGRLVPGDMQRYQWHVLESVYRHLEERSPLACDGDDALKTLRVLDTIQREVSGLNS